MATRFNYPQVGVALCIRRDNKILLHKRIGDIANGYWAFPGGHPEKWESWEECSLRETDEECGVVVTKPKFWTAVNALFRDEGRHYVTILTLADWVSGEAERKEPNKCECWEWFAWDNLPSPLMIGISEIVEKGMNPFND